MVYHRRTTKGNLKKWAGVKNGKFFFLQYFVCHHSPMMGGNGSNVSIEYYLDHCFFSGPIYSRALFIPNNSRQRLR